MLRHLIVVSLSVLSIGFSFASDNNIYCEYTEWQDWIYSGSNNIGFICSQNNILAEAPELKVKDLKKDNYWVFWNLYYNDQLLATNLPFNDIYSLRTVIDKKNKSIVVYTWFGDVYDSLHTIQKMWFNGVSSYTISYKWTLNPIVTLNTSKYLTTIYFADNSKNYIDRPTINNKYTGLYMKKINKTTKEETIKTLYSFSPIPYKEFFSDSDSVIFNISPVLDKNLTLHDKYYVFKTNTRKIQLDLTHTWKTIVKKLK